MQWRKKELHVYHLLKFNFKYLIKKLYLKTQNPKKMLCKKLFKITIIVCFFVDYVIRVIFQLYMFEISHKFKSF